MSIYQGQQQLSSLTAVTVFCDSLTILSTRSSFRDSDMVAPTYTAAYLCLKQIVLDEKPPRL